LSSLKKQGLTALIWDFFGKLSTQGMGFIVTIILARLLEPSDFGLVAMIMVVVGMAQVFSDVGLGSALIQKKEVLSIHYSSVFYFNLSIAFILALITYLSADSVASFYENKQLVPLIEVISILYILNALSSMQTIKLRKQLLYSVITKGRVIASVLSGVIGVGLAYKGAGVWSLVGQMLSHSIFNNVYLWLFSGWRPRTDFSFRALRQLWAFGFRMFIVSLMNAITTRLDFLIIGKLFPVATLGYFQRAKSLNLLVIQYTSGSLMSVLFPILSEVQTDLVRFRNIVNESLNILAALVFLLVGCLYLSSENIIVFLYSDKWLPSVQYMELLLLSAFSYPLNALYVNILSSRGNSKSFLKMAIIKKLIFVTNLALGFTWGIKGYLIGLIFVSFINIYISIHFSSREIGVSKWLLGKPLLVQMFIWLVSLSLTLIFLEKVELSKFAEFLVSNTVFVVIFIFCNWLFKSGSWLSISKQASPLYIKYFKKS